MPLIKDGTPELWAEFTEKSALELTWWCRHLGEPWEDFLLRDPQRNIPCCWFLEVDLASDKPDASSGYMISDRFFTAYAEVTPDDQRMNETKTQAEWEIAICLLRWIWWVKRMCNPFGRCPRPAGWSMGELSRCYYPSVDGRCSRGFGYIRWLWLAARSISWTSAAWTGAPGELIVGRLSCENQRVKPAVSKVCEVWGIVKVSKLEPGFLIATIAWFSCSWVYTILWP